MSRKQKLVLLVATILGLVIVLIWYIVGHNIAVFEPHGPIGRQERSLINTAIILSMIVVVPVYIMLAAFAWKYREGNKKAKYQPDFDHSRLYESVWWGIPLVIIGILAVITWQSSYRLDPFRPISSAPPMVIQAVSLQWKWLFIYPHENIASINYIQFPVNTPIKFEITSDAPMNSFWIPQLGGQIYAMSGMKTGLNLSASEPGSYQGVSANISGEGFAGMHFVAKAGTQKDFMGWVHGIRHTKTQLDQKAYDKLALPSKDDPVSYFGRSESGLFDMIVNKYMEPGGIMSERPAE